MSLTLKNKNFPDFSLTAGNPVKLQCICKPYNPLLFIQMLMKEVNSHRQLALNSDENRYSLNLSSLSKEKSVTLLVRWNKKTDLADRIITLGGHPLKQEGSIKYLGVYVDQNLSWNEQCGKLCVHIAEKSAVLRRIRSFVKSGGRFKNTYELLNLRALKFSPGNKIHTFQCMGKIFCVEFQRYPLKFYTKYLTHTLKDMIFIQLWNFKSS